MSRCLNQNRPRTIAEHSLEMARAVARHGDLEPAQPLPVPRNLEELVVSRIATLSAPARQLALAAAATSQPTLSVLASAIQPDADFGAALLEAEEAGVLTSEDDRIRFEHPLLASVIYGSASPERRRQPDISWTFGQSQGRHTPNSQPVASDRTACIGGNV